MPSPQLLNDVISVLLLLAPSAAILSLVLAGVSLRREGTMTFAIGGGFTKWMFWAVIFLTLQPLLSWFSSFGVSTPLPSGGIATSWLSNFQADLSQFISHFVLQRPVPTLAAFSFYERFWMRHLASTCWRRSWQRCSCLERRPPTACCRPTTLARDTPRSMFSTVSGTIWRERSCRSQLFSPWSAQS
jgi:hypothetical protein